MHWFTAAFALCCLVTACSVDSPMNTEIPEVAAESAEQVLIGNVHWFVDYDAAATMARAEDKPLWVHFGEHPG
jgi:hypothetical protein